MVETEASTAAIESTWMYWKTLFCCLEEVIEIELLHSAHMKGPLAA